MATAEESAERPLKAEPRLTLREQWAERARVRKLVLPVDMSKFPDEPPLFIRKLSASEVHAFQDKFADTENKQVERERNDYLVSMCICDESGGPVLEPEDVGSLPLELHTHILTESLVSLGYRKPTDTAEDENQEGKAAPSGG